jgi:acetyltransferase-like isoleucine patch superfamily enzyme
MPYCAAVIIIFGIIATAFLALKIVIFLWLAIYCRAMKCISRQISLNRNSTTKASLKAAHTSILIKVYRALNPYFYGLMRYSIVKVGRIPSFRIRRFFYKYVFCMQITKKTIIYGGCEIRSPWNIKADNCVISNNCLLDGRYGITIGNNVVFGVGVHIWTAEHSVNDPYFEVLPSNCQPVNIHNRAWICSDTTILPGVTIGEGAVIASRACLTKNAEAFGVYGGVPAKKIGDRNTGLLYELDGKPTWHFYC